MTACTDTPSFDITHDLQAGTVAGQIDLELMCPGLELCRENETVAATVSGTFGPLAYGQQPEKAPEEWPFPADHYYSSGMGFWWAGGPIELDVSIVGSNGFLNKTVDVSTTVTGWVDSSLSPMSLKPGELPTDWGVDLRVNIEYVETDESGAPRWPRWDFYVGYNGQLEEAGVDIPSWRN